MVTNSKLPNNENRRENTRTVDDEGDVRSS